MGSLSEEVRTEVLCGHICDLEAENAKLRQQLADVTESMGRVEERCAKLRELCGDLYAIRDRSGTYHVTALQVRLDELGVEVSE